MPLVPCFTLLEVIHGVVIAYTYTDSTLWTTRAPRFIILWNPAIRRHVSTPLPPEDMKSRQCYVGVGFDTSINNFKDIWIPYAVEVEYYKVFSAHAGAWRKKKCRLPGSYIMEYSRGCFFNESNYGIASRFEGTKYPHDELVYFDCESEVFGRTKLHEQVICSTVLVYGGLLSMITSGTTAGMDTGMQYRLLTMKELGVWTKRFIITDTLFRGDDCVFQEIMLLMDIGKSYQNLHKYFKCSV